MTFFLESIYNKNRVNIIDKQDISLNPLLNFKSEAYKKKSMIKTNKEPEVKPTITTIIEPIKVAQPAGSNYE